MLELDKQMQMPSSLTAQMDVFPVQSYDNDDNGLQ